MSARKRGTTYHGNKRFEQRYEGDTKNLDDLMARALHYGVHVSQIPESNPLYDFLKTKKDAKNKRLRVIDGYVLIMTKTSNRLITMYKVPDEYAEAMEGIMAIQESNRKFYREVRRKKGAV